MGEADILRCSYYDGCTFPASEEVECPIKGCDKKFGRCSLHGGVESARADVDDHLMNDHDMIRL